MDEEDVDHQIFSEGGIFAVTQPWREILDRWAAESSSFDGLVSPCSTLNRYNVLEEKKIVL